MATCKECIHERVCFALIKTGLPYVDDKHPAEAFCMAFKPTTDVAEVKHGEWKKRGNEKTCSVCEFIYYSNNDDWNYCPNCGAKMDGGMHEIRLTTKAITEAWAEIKEASEKAKEIGYIDINPEDFPRGSVFETIEEDDT